MPPVALAVAQAVAYAVGYAGASAAVIHFSLAAAYFLTTAALTFGGSYLIGRLIGPKLPGGALLQASPLQMTKQPVTPRRVIYGQTRVSGAIVYMLTSGTKNEYLHVVIVLAGHECAEIGDIYFNDELAVTAAGVVNSPFTGLVRVNRHLGSDSQTADSDLVAESGGQWTTNHRLRGIAYVYVRLKFDQSIFPGGIPNISAVVKGRKVWNARSGFTEWSDNPALIVRDYLADAAYGLRVDYATELHEASFDAAANICDEAVALAAGGTEKRYTLNGSFDLSAEPATVLEQMTGSMAGFITYIGGVWRCQAGAHQTPTETLTENDARGPISVQTKLSLRDTCNRVKGTYLSPAEKWQPTDCPPVVNSTYLAEDGGLEIWRDLQLSFTNSASMGQRLFKIELERTRQDMIVTMPCKLTALRVRAGEVVRVNKTRFGWSGKMFTVTGLKFSLYDSAGAPALGVDLTLRETAAEVWDWASGEETIADPAPNTTLADPRNVAAPTGVTLTSGATTVMIQKDGTAVPRLKVAWTAPNDQAVQSGGRIRVQYKRSADSDWSEAAPVQGAQTFLYLLDVQIGTAYDVRVQSENNFGVVSSWATPTPTSHTVTGDTAAPSAISAPTAVAYPGFNLVAWAASTAADISEYRVYRHTSATFAGATYLGETPGLEWRDQGATPGTAYYYYILPVDFSENPPLGTTTNVSTASGAVTTLLAPVGATTPSNPTAAAKPGTPVDGTYLAGDGTVFSFITLSVPAMPANAVWQNLLYRRTGSGDWLVAAQLKNTGTATLRLDDLSAGVSYDVATQAWSGAGGSAVIAATGSPFAAPGKTTLPTAPTSVVYVGGSDAAFGRPAVFSAGSQMFVVRANWTAPADKDVAYYEWAVTTGDTDADADAASKQRANSTEAILTAGTPITRYFRVRAIDTSGNASAWAGGGTNMNTAPLWGYAAGTMVNQNASGVAVTGGTLTGLTNIETTGEKVGGSGARKIEARYVETVVLLMTGGAAYEDKSISISGRGFTTKPDVGKIEVAGTDTYNTDYLAFYNYDNGGNSSSSAWVKIFRPSGANVEAGRYVRLSVEFIEYA